MLYAFLVLTVKKWLKSVHIYGSCCKNKTGITFLEHPVYMCYTVLAVSKAYKTLENEEGYKRCQEIVEEAKSRVDEAVSCLVAVVNRLVTVFFRN